MEQVITLRGNFKLLKEKEEERNSSISRIDIVVIMIDVQLSW